MDTTVWAIIIATIVMFAVGAFWYSLPFRKKWAQIHGFDKLSEKEQQALMKSMGLTYGIQLIMTIVMSAALVYSIVSYPGIPFFLIAIFVWLGFVVPSQVSAVLFSRTPDQYKAQQIAVMSGEALVRLVITSWIISLIV